MVLRSADEWKRLESNQVGTGITSDAGWTQTKEEGLSSKGTNGSLRILSKFNS